MNNWLFYTEQEILASIGESLKKIRVQHNLTQSTMAKEVGLSVSTISLMEKGQSSNLESLIRVLIRLNRISELEGVFRVSEDLELKLKFEEAKMKSIRKRASKKSI